MSSSLLCEMLTAALHLVFVGIQLSLSQDSQEEEECHELVVDVENDHDGEGISRWAAMTEFLSLISYKVRCS